MSIAACPAITEKALAGEKGRFPGQRASFKGVGRQSVFQFLYAVETNRHLGVYHRVNSETGFLGTSSEMLRRPSAPFLIFLKNIKENIAVNHH